MEVHLMNYDGLNCLESQIGCHLADGSFVVAPECIDSLQELFKMLESEDIMTRPVRCRLAFMDIVKQTLVPLILNLDDVDTDERHLVFMSAMKLLAHLTQPIECLIPDQQISGTSRVLAKEIENFITRTQILFTQQEINNAILGENLSILEQCGFEKPVPEVQSEAINYTIYFYRNLLFSVDKQSTQDSLPVHAKILRWILKFGMQKILMKTILSPQRDYWCVAVVQLLSLMFRDDRCMEDMYNGSDSSASLMRTQGLLSSSGSQVTNQNKESSSSSLDDFSVLGQAVSSKNNSPHSPSITKRDVAQVNSNPKGKGQEPENAVPVENGHMEETAVNGDREETGMEEQQISEEAKLKECVEEADAWNQIREGMSELCSDFLQNGWLLLLKCIKNIMLSQSSNKYQLQPHYFMWLVQHFTQLLPVYDIPFCCIREGLSVDTIGFLVYRSVMAFQQMKIAKHNQQSLSPYVKQTFLPLVALHQTFNAISHYWETCQEQNDKVYLITLMGYLTGLEDLGLYFVQLIRQIDIQHFGKYLLQEAILATHKFLLMADLVHANRGHSHRPLNLLTYVPNFANPHMMLQYGQILKDFKQNSSLLNQSIFTMMHHVAGECDQPESLLQAPIIQTFINILDMASSKKIIPQECHDLMEFILQTCLRCLDADPLSCVCLLVGLDINETKRESDNKKPEDPPTSTVTNSNPDEEQSKLEGEDFPPWTPEEEDELFALVSQQNSNSINVNEIVCKLQDICIDKSHKHVMVELCRHGIISAEKMMEQLSLEPEKQQQLPSSCDPGSCGHSWKRGELEDLSLLPAPIRIQHCVKHLTSDSRSHWLDWLQGALLEAIYVKVIPDICQVRPKEPVFWHCSMLNQPMPLVPYTVQQEEAMKNAHFKCLLQAIGLEIPEPLGVAYPVIPAYMSPRHLWENALMLSPISPEKLSFDPNDIMTYESKFLSQTACPATDPFASQESAHSTAPDVQMWPYLVQKFNRQANKHEPMAQGTD